MAPPGPRRSRFSEGIVVLFIAAWLALNYPLLAIFDRAALLFGIPVLFLYLFIIWLVIIISKMLLTSRAEPDVGPAKQAVRRD